MRLRRLAAERFRNLEPFDLDIPTQFVVLHGSNAQGKTNALEAIHVLATLKGLRGRRFRELVAWGQSDGAVAGSVEHQGIERQYRVELSPRGRQARLDGKRVSDLEEYFRGVRGIAFTPSDGRIVSEEPARRRAWLDRAAFTAAPAHLARVRAYRHCLQQKGAALRQSSPDATLLDALDQQLAVRGAELVTHRVRMLETLRPHVYALHGALAGASDTLALAYHSATEGGTTDERARSLASQLAESRSRELQRRTTLVGPQLDDVRIDLAGRRARSFASRGQVRSIVLALKLGEMVAAQERGEVPLFLIDDASTELDATRTRRLMERLTALGAQVFATTTDAGPLLDALPDTQTLLIEVNAGTLTVRTAGS